MTIIIRIMETYKITTLDNGDILLQKNVVDNNTYTIINKDNGDKLLKKNTNINIIDIEYIKDYDFANSTITKCSINEQEFNKLNYKPILEEIYNLINNGTKIILNTKLNIKTIKKEDRGFYYLENIGISIQGVDSNKCLLEIINQCIKNQITLSMKIKLLNEITININF